MAAKACDWHLRSSGDGIFDLTAAEELEIEGLSGTILWIIKNIKKGVDKFCFYVYNNYCEFYRIGKICGTT